MSQTNFRTSHFIAVKTLSWKSLMSTLFLCLCVVRSSCELTSWSWHLYEFNTIQWVSTSCPCLHCWTVKWIKDVAKWRQGINNRCHDDITVVCYWSVEVLYKAKYSFLVKPHEVRHIPALMSPSRACARVPLDVEHTRSAGWLQSSEQVTASGKKQCSHFLKVSRRFLWTFSSDCTPSKRCCLISIYGHVPRCSVLLEYLKISAIRQNMQKYEKSFTVFPFDTFAHEEFTDSNI